VSAAVSTGAAVVAEDVHAAHAYPAVTLRRTSPLGSGHAKTVILGTAAHAIGKLGGGLSTLKATELGGIAISPRSSAAAVAPDRSTTS
jgi:hypothetical protein